MNTRGWIGIVVLLMMLLASGDVLGAQDESNELKDDPAQSETPSDQEKQARELEAERAADLREAINENLVEDSSPESEGKEQAESQPLTKDEEQDQQEEYWYSKYESITTNIQNLPEKIPGLAGKGWLHFGRVEVEYGYFSEGILKPDSGFNFRSLRGGIVRRVGDRLTVKFELDATDGDSNWADLYGRFNTKLGVFTLGNQKIAQTLVGQTSRLSRTFMEEPLPADAFGLGRRLGVGWDVHRNKLGAHLTAFGRDLNENIGKFGYGARVYVNPAKTRFSMFHLGISAVREKMDRDAQFRAYPESRVTNTRLVDTGQHSEVDDQSILGLEMAGARGSFSVRSEYFNAEWERSTKPNAKFEGYYLQANWAITGESFQYAQGKFLRLRPKSPRGAWEVALRFSTVNLNDQDVLGGKEKNLALALNWYGPGNQLRVMSNLIYVETDPVAGKQSPLIAQVRVQLNW